MGTFCCAGTAPIEKELKIFDELEKSDAAKCRKYAPRGMKNLQETSSDLEGMSMNDNESLPRL